MLRFMQGLLLSIMVGMVHSRLLRWVAAAEATGRRLVRHAGHARLQDVVGWGKGVVPRKKDPNPHTAFTFTFVVRTSDGLDRYRTGLVF